MMNQVVWAGHAVVAQLSKALCACAGAWEAAASCGTHTVDIQLSAL